MTALPVRCETTQANIALREIKERPPYVLGQITLLLSHNARGKHKTLIMFPLQIAMPGRQLLLVSS